MIYVISIVLKSWFREGVITIASKDDSHVLSWAANKCKASSKEEAIGASSSAATSARADRRQHSGSASTGMTNIYRGLLRVFEHRFPKESTGEAVNE